MYKYSLMVSLAIMNTATAGWFGPDNYEECVVDKMKGQDKSMLKMVEKACEAKFPKPVSVAEYAGFGDNKEIKIDWMGNVVKVLKNDTTYEITEVIMIFSRKKCDDITSNAYWREYSDYDSPYFHFKIKDSIGYAEEGFNPAIYGCGLLVNVYGLGK